MIEQLHLQILTLKAKLSADKFVYSYQIEQMCTDWMGYCNKINLLFTLKGDYFGGANK